VPTGREADGLGDGTVGLEFNLPASKQFGAIYVHANAGVRWLPDIERRGFIAASGIWRATAMLNVMLEAIERFDEGVTLSPGFRRAWNLGEKQIVFGLALPVTRSGGSSEVSVLSYFSYELPFR
jgi:hypothetical protein